MLNKIKTVCKFYYLYWLISWVSYGISHGLLDHMKFKEKSKKFDEEGFEYEIYTEPVIFKAFKNFKKFFKWVIE